MAFHGKNCECIQIFGYLYSVYMKLKFTQIQDWTIGSIKKKLFVKTTKN